MYFTNEIRQVDEFRTDLDLVKEKELALATHLIEALAAKFEPEKYKDTYRDNLLAMIDQKIQGQKVVEAPEPHIAPVIDIMEALKRTLEIRKKPVQAASEAAATEEAAVPKRKKARGREALQLTCAEESLPRKARPSGVSSCLKNRKTSFPSARILLADAAILLRSSGEYSALRSR